MYCKKCGHEIPEGINVCPNCNFSNEQETKQTTVNDNTSPKKETSYPFIFCILASAILIVAMVVPFVSIQFLGEKLDVSLLKGTGDGYGDGIYFIGIAIISLILSLFRFQFGVIASGISALVLSIIKSQNFSEIGYSSSLIHKEIGYYLMFLGSILIILAGIYGLITKRKISPKSKK